MRTDDPQSTTDDSSEAFISQDIVERMLAGQLRDNITPLSIEIDCTALRKWAQEQAQERFRHQNLIKELRLWAPLISRRPVNRLWLNDPFLIMDAPSLTELVYGLGQNLKLMQGRHIEHMVTLGETEFTRQNIALLRGLEFNHIQIRVNADAVCIRTLQNLVQTLADFKFSFISIHLGITSALTDSSLIIMELLSFIAPATLTLSQASNQPIDFRSVESLVPMLMQFGYFFQAPDTLMKFQSPLHNRPRDCLRLGPASVSVLGRLSVHNSPNARHYLGCLAQGQLPVATCR